jgi:heptosyltransferase-2
MPYTINSISVNKVLIIQTAFIGDVILSTAVGHKLAIKYPNAKIHYVVRKGNESLVEELSFVDHVWVWDKKKKKTKNLFEILKKIRTEKYDYVINLQRFMSSGILTSFSKGRNKIGFKKNPLSFLFDKTFEHAIGNGKHEVERNQLLIEGLTDDKASRPVLEIPENLPEITDEFIKDAFICIAPASVWFTKQFPYSKWIEFIDKLPKTLKIVMLGAPADSKIALKISEECKNHKIIDLCGKVSLIASAAIMKKAVMNYVNDSAPLHLASAVNAPVRAVFCSTVPEFGFGPLSDNSKIVQVSEKLACRPCGLHGKKECPIGTFECALKINTGKMANELENYLSKKK